MARYIGGIDAGGTTFKCGLKQVGGDWVARRRIPTARPEETVAACTEFFRNAMGDLGASSSSLVALGVASFGPLNLDAGSQDYGSLLGTPKPHWSGFPIRQAFEEALDIKVCIDTDVNAALMAEMADGTARDVANAAYVTIGTGIGAGLSSGGQIVGRPRHPEFGHIPVSRAKGDGEFGGTCAYHATCLEGMASVTALKARFGDPVEWSADHAGWIIAADYLAQACRIIFLTTCAEKIILGGGFMTSQHILTHIHQSFVEQMAGYLSITSDDAKCLIVTPHLGDDAGLHGAILLSVIKSGMSSGR